MIAQIRNDNRDRGHFLGPEEYEHRNYKHHRCGDPCPDGNLINDRTDGCCDAYFLRDEELNVFNQNSFMQLPDEIGGPTSIAAGALLGARWNSAPQPLRCPLPVFPPYCWLHGNNVRRSLRFRRTRANMVLLRAANSARARAGTIRFGTT